MMSRELDNPDLGGGKRLDWYMALVERVVKRFHGGPNFEDELKSEGILHVLELKGKVEEGKLDAELFANPAYVAECVKNRLVKVFINDAPIPHPHSKKDKLIREAEEQLVKELGRRPEAEELAHRLPDVSGEDIRNWLARPRLKPITLEGQSDTGEDVPALGIQLPDPQGRTPLDQASTQELYSAFPDLIRRAHLTPEEVLVLLLRWGLAPEDSVPQPRQRVAELLSRPEGRDEAGGPNGQKTRRCYTRESIRLIERGAWRKLRLAAHTPPPA
jgi:hypothetical protein